MINLSNNQGNVINVVIKQRNVPDPKIVWKEDSLILNSRNLLNSGKITEVLAAFRRAYNQNPEHYYLSHFIRILNLFKAGNMKSRDLFLIYIQVNTKV